MDERQFHSPLMILSSAFSRANIFALSIYFLTAVMPAFAIDLPDGMGKVSGDFRYRYEIVDDASRADIGKPSTARLRLGYETPAWNDIKAYGEVEAVRHIGHQKFDDGINGRTQYPRIADPDMTGINQAYIEYDGVLGMPVHARIGRQPITYDNQRFVAWSKTRQNDTTHDAVSLIVTPIDNLDLAYAYSRKLNRFTGERTAAGDYEGDLHFLNAHYTINDVFGVSVYNYTLDFDGSERNLSSRTTGILGTWDKQGNGWQPFASAEFAHQADHGESPLSYGENYLGLAAGMQKDKAVVALGFEHIGGNGRNAALQTPLASLHNVLGWTEKFGTTPVEGLQDIKLTVNMPFDLPQGWFGEGVALIGNVHHFTSVENDLHYGDEAGMGLIYTLVKNRDITAKYARYQAQDRFTDTDRFTVSYDMKF